MDESLQNMWKGLADERQRISYVKHIRTKKNLKIIKYHNTCVVNKIMVTRIGFLIYIYAKENEFYFGYLVPNEGNSCNSQWYNGYH